jgi:hypothetical protein
MARELVAQSRSLINVLSTYPIGPLNYLQTMLTA